MIGHKRFLKRFKKKNSVEVETSEVKLKEVKTYARCKGITSKLLANIHCPASDFPDIMVEQRLDPELRVIIDFLEGGKLPDGDKMAQKVL